MKNPKLDHIRVCQLINFYSKYDRYHYRTAVFVTSFSKFALWYPLRLSARVKLSVRTTQNKRSTKQKPARSNILRKTKPWCVVVGASVVSSPTKPTAVAAVEPKEHGASGMQQHIDISVWHHISRLYHSIILGVVWQQQRKKKKQNSSMRKDKKKENKMTRTRALQQLNRELWYWYVLLMQSSVSDRRSTFTVVYVRSGGKKKMQNYTWKLEVRKKGGSASSSNTLSETRTQTART